ncbi:MAG: glycosyltransferase family 1 protein [Planctomycetota bacterium]|nr:MAG: glycosyltransferase family 1 protein [Planctomycetota bacterium]
MTPDRVRGVRPVVLHVRMVTGTGGGPEKTILHSPPYLEEAGFRCLCAYLRPPGDPGFDVLRKRAEARGVELLEFDDHGPFDVGLLRRLVRLCREENVAIWHGHDYKTDTFGLLAARFHRMHLVSTTHGWGVHTGRAKLYNRIHKFVLRFFARVICVSQALQQECCRAGIPPTICRVIPNGIDVRPYDTPVDRASLRRSLELPEDRFIVLWVGRISEEKDLPTLIAAAAEVHTSQGPPLVVLVGEGDERPALESQVRRAGREGNVVFAGFQVDPVPWYRAADAFVLPSLREGLPNVLLEAMAAGLPVIASSVGGIPQAIEHETTGLLCPPGDTAAFREALQRIADDRAFAARLGRSARQKIESEYAFARRMNRIIEIYRELLDENEAS